MLVVERRREFSSPVRKNKKQKPVLFSFLFLSVGNARLFCRVSGQQQQRSFIIVYVQSSRENARTRRRRERQHAQDTDEEENGEKKTKHENNLHVFFVC